MQQDLKGASGEIQYSSDPRYYGNPIGLSVPIVRIVPTNGGTTVFQTLESTDPLQGPAPATPCQNR